MFIPSLNVLANLRHASKEFRTVLAGGQRMAGWSTHIEWLKFSGKTNIFVPS